MGIASRGLKMAGEKVKKMLFYIILGAFCAAIVGGLVCIVTRAGESDGICKYSSEEDVEQ